jgi:bis(5'-nucleosyl)-tetraphosphatase (symmetrical)
MVFLIGDIQGCDAALERLLQACGFSPSRDRLVALGDLVNRGPGSLAVLRRLWALEGAAECVLGNHDLHLLAVAHGARARHHGDTFGDVLDAPDRDAWLGWLRARPLAVVESGWLCVHAGVAPAWTLEEALALAGEIETVLRGPGLGEFLHGMYGNEPARWSPGLRGLERWRFAVNAFTRIRFCAADGTLDLVTKEGAAAAPPGHQPWFDLPERRSAGKPVAFGHWSTLGLVNRPDLLALDTGCVWGGFLTAARIDGGRREIIQVRCQQPQVQEQGRNGPEGDV